MIEFNQVYHQDCLEGMQEIQDKSIDMILCDLPYGTTACKWDVIIPFEPLWKQNERVIKDNGAIVLTASQPFTTDIINSNRKLFRYELIWDKLKGTDFAWANRKPLKSFENILLFYKKLPTYNPQKVKREKSLNSTNWKQSKMKCSENNNFSSKVATNKKIYIDKFPLSVLPFHKDIAECNGLNRLHPTQKPVALFEYLIKTYTNEGEAVLDNCMGSGTTAIACINTNRNYIGFEKDEKYYNITQERIKNHVVQTAMTL